MLCPDCKDVESRASEVYDSRRIANGQIVKRRRICRNCNELFTTLEITVYQGKGNHINRKLVRRLATYFSKSPNLADLC
jgi:transcriptional regulator NrdR family protein